MTKSKLLLGVTASATALLIDLVANLASSDKHWPGPLDLLREHGWLSFAVLGAVTIGFTIVMVLKAEEDPSRVEEDLAAVGEELAIAVRLQWHDETRLRQVNDPYPIPIEWHPAEKGLAADWSSLVKLATEGSGWPTPAPEKWVADHTGLAGADSEIVNVLDRVPTGRLIVLGQPGSGKTVLLIRLLLGILNARKPGEAIPVLLSLASWNPEDEDLLTWIVGRLITDYAALARPVRRGSKESAARALLNRGFIIPVLDGLDEVPSAVLGLTVARINEALPPGMKLVVAARTEAFEQAVRPPCGVEVQLAGAAAIEICPLQADVTLKYLRDSAGGAAAADRWEPVRAALTSNQYLPASEALTTPLMAMLARTIYNPRPDEPLARSSPSPIELLDQAQFPCRDDVERYLYDTFIPAVYRPRVSQPTANAWSAAQAQRWLAFLARDLEDRQHGTTDLAWWELRGAAPRPLGGLVVGLAAGLAGMLGLSVPFGLGAGLIVAASAAALTRRWVQPEHRILPRGLAGGLLGGMLGALAAVAIFGGARLDAYLVGGLAFGIIVAPIAGFVGGLVGGFAGSVGSRTIEVLLASHGLRPNAHIVNGVALGLAIGLVAGLAARGTPARHLRRSRLGTLCGLGTGIITGLATWTTAGPKPGLAVGIAATIAAGYAGGVFFEAAATDVTRATTPSTVLRRDRSTFRTSFLGFGIAMGLGTGLATGFEPSQTSALSSGLDRGLGVGLANLVAAGLAFGFIQTSWGSFTLSRCWLAVVGDLPWRFMGFLADAHANRGVLRQVGAVYQFRHAGLQRRLADSSLAERRFRPRRALRAFVAEQIEAAITKSRNVAGAVRRCFK